MKNIKKVILSSLMAVVVVATVALSEYFPDIIVTSPNGLWTDTRAYSSINAAITAVGTETRDIYIIRQEITSVLTVPATVRLHFLASGSIANVGQLTLNTKNILAGSYRIFTGVGNIDFAPGTVLKSSWFSNIESALALTTNDTVTIKITDPQTITASYSPGVNVSLMWEAPGNILTVNAGVTVDNINQITAGNYQILAGAGNFRFRDGTTINLSWVPHLRTAINWIDTSNVTLLVNAPATVDFSDTVLATTNLVVNKGALLTVSAGITLTINSLDAGPYPIFAGLGTAAPTGNVTKCYPEWWGDVADMTAPLQAMLNSAVKNKYLVPGKHYSYTGLTTPNPTEYVYFGTEPGSNSARLIYTPAVGDGITIGGNLNHSTFANFIMTSPANSTGWAMQSAHTNASGNGTRNLIIYNVTIADFLKGIDIWCGVRVIIEEGNKSGQGAGAAGGIGIKLGEDGASSLNLAILRGPYITAYETAIHNAYCTNVEIESPIIGTSNTGILTAIGQNFISNGYFESNTTAINHGASSYVYGDAILNGVGNAMVAANERFRLRTGPPVNVVARRSAALNVNGGPHIFICDVEESDTEDLFSVVTGEFTAPYTDFYTITPNIGFTMTVAAQTFSVDIYRTPLVGAAAPLNSTNNTYQAAAAGVLSGTLSRDVWLRGGERIDIRLTTSANLAMAIGRIDIKSGIR